MEIRTWAAPAAGLVLAFSSPSGAVAAGAEIAPAIKCDALTSFKIPVSTMVIEKASAVPEAPPNTVDVWPGAPVKAAVTIPANCLAEGYLDKRTGGDGKEYAIRFKIALPDKWNGRFLFQGGAGLNGVLRPPIGTAIMQAVGKSPALARGFAVVTTDSGHEGKVFDPSFMRDQEAALNFAQASVGKVTMIAKSIIHRYYGRAPAHSYYLGCSTGGREGMLAAQRYPGEYDGVAGSPAMNTDRSNLGLAWGNYLFTQISPKDKDGKPDTSKAFSSADGKLIANAILEQCDAKDGLKDGLIFNAKACHFDPSTIQCTGAKTDSCLTKGQADALAKAMAGPKNSRGDEPYIRYPWDSGIAAEGVPIPGIVTTGSRGPVNPPFLEKINVDAIEDQRNDSGQGRLQLTSYWTNLNSYFARGGKILFYHGLSDPWFSALDTVRYYERMAKTSGGMEKVRANSSRIFLVPGMGHCGSGKTLDQFDLLSAVVDWVEKGEAPESVVATGRAFPGRSRPLCAYPKFAVYKGKGDPEDAANFECSE